MTEILDMIPQNAEETIYKSEVNPMKLDACIDKIISALSAHEKRLSKLEELTGQDTLMEDLDMLLILCHSCVSKLMDTQHPEEQYTMAELGVLKADIEKMRFRLFGAGGDK